MPSSLDKKSSDPSPPVDKDMSDLPPPIDKELSDPPPLKRQKTEEILYCYHTEGGFTESEWREFVEEVEKTDGFEMDFSKYRCWFQWNPLDLTDNELVDEPETNTDLAARMANRALAEHNAERGTELKLDKVWRANYHPCYGYNFYISFDVIDPSENKVKPYRAEVQYMFNDDMEVISCMPKPSP